MATDEQPRSLLTHRAILVAVILLVFGRLLTAGFSGWDDPITIQNNPALLQPNWNALRYLWTHESMGLYVPVTYTVWWLLARGAYLRTPLDDGTLLNPAVFHAASILLHAAAALMVHQLLRRAKLPPPAALFGALLFAVHPVQVETVGWPSGMKDLLCWTQVLGALLLIQSQSNSKPADASFGSMWRDHRPIVAIVLLISAGLSKPSAMVFPAAAFVIDHFINRRPVLKSLGWLTPFFVVSVGIMILARLVQPAYEAHRPPLHLRPFVAGDALFFYIQHVLFPAGLCIDYGRRPEVVLSWTQTYFVWIVPAAIGVTAFVLRKRFPLVVAGLALAVVGVAPLLGFVPFLFQIYSTVSDHYLYFSMAGVALVAAAVFDRVPKPIAVGVAGVIVLACAAKSFVQAGAWHSERTLIDHTLKVNPNSQAGLGNLGGVLLSENRLDEAIAAYERIVELSPNYTVARIDLSTTLARTGRTERADAEFRKADELLQQDSRRTPQKLANEYVDFARALLIGNDVKRAEYWLNRAAELDPENERLRDTRIQIRNANLHSE